MSRSAWIAAFAALALALCVYIVSSVPAAAELGDMVGLLFLHAPHVPFDEAKAPPAPDYADPANWAALPDRPNSSDAAPAGYAPVAADKAAADVFFIHPTTDLGDDHWNADMRDKKVDARTDKGTIRNQASVFNGCCRIYAPRYRQMTLGGFFAADEDHRKAEDLAYSDVKRAFEYYLAHDNHGRPFIIAGHSQGSGLGTRLVREMIDGTPLMARFVAAYLGGTWIDADTFAAMKEVKPCARADETGCVLVWASLAGDADAQAQRDGFAKRWLKPPAFAHHRFVCTNPLTWTTSDAPAPAADDLGGWMHGGGDKPRAPDVGLVGARCDDGALFVTRPPIMLYRLFQLPGGNYHNMDYQLFYMNIRKNAQTRVAAFLKKD